MFNRTAFLLGLSLLVGCGGGGIEVKLAPVTGVVTKDGKPLPDVKVVLETTDPAAKAPLLFGMSNAEGRYEIQTSAGEKGAPEGVYKVYLVPSAPAASMDYSAKGKPGAPQKSTDLIPASLQSPKTTELSVDVKASGATLDITVPK